MNPNLISKYNVPVPRYTSYPTVPDWQTKAPTESEWISRLLTSYDEASELSLYIHLPFCEALCTYCGCNKRITKNHDVESPYIEAVMKEWDIYRSYFPSKPVIKEIHLGGGTPTFFKASKLKKLLSHILDTAEVSEIHEFSFEAHPNSTNSDHLRTLFDLGFRRISIGVQDVSPEILKAINRQQTQEEVRNLTRWARALGYTSINYDIIYGLPFQKPMNVWNTAQFISVNRPDRIAFYSYAHVPWKSANQRAFTLADVPQGQKKSELYELGSYLLAMEGYKAVGMDHFCQPDEQLYKAYQAGQMHRNFMGYTPNYTKASIALGVSSISDSWDAYVQNEKHVETYQEIVEGGKLPIIKGHLLTSKQEMMRTIILSIMCKDYVEWNSLEEYQMIKDLLPNLDGLVKDNLVSYNSNSITIKPDGRLFIRNICAAIDPIFQNMKNTKEVYSKAI
ncbi:MAG: oxygen-independent coproporphyrinogen-3 oxidase [Saprospiraceae bacterium]|jgi:oxygen-independent coproporphyrinogen-3 oxidase